MKIVLLILLVLAMTGLLLVGCDGGDAISEIYITKADMPQLKYVEGQELNLTTGRLTVVNKDGESKLPLTDPAITVSGYDKTKLGQQELTVQYGQLTTKLVVTVEARMVAENFETRYFVGDIFNNKMGKIRVVGDDAKAFTVNMNDPKVSLVSFDSSKAGPATVTVQYSDGKNNYQCSFSVTVYEESNVEFTAPYKSKYYSYDAGIDVNGGHFTVTSADGKLTKRVPVTEDMISGFDLSLATMEHRVTPLTQTVTVTYLGHQFQYDIQISFQGISVVNYHAQNALKKIDWADAKINGFPEDIADAALEAIQEYYNLPQDQYEKVDPSVRNLVGRAGTVAVMIAFQKELEKYAQTIAMDNQGNLYFVCASYEQTVADLESLNDVESDINVYAQLLRKIREEFGSTLLDSEVAVMDLIHVYTEETEILMRDTLNHFVSIHTLLADIPADWNRETLKAHGNDIMAVAMEVHNAGYYRRGFAGYYTEVIAHWRENRDMFDILYTYFLYEYETGKEFMANYMFGHMPLPGMVEHWYRSLSNASGFANFLSANGGADAFLADTTVFMYHYYQTLDIANAIKESDNQLWIDVYEAYNGDGMNRYYMDTYPNGFMQLAKGMVDVPAYHRVWEAYYQVMREYSSNTLSAETHKDMILAMYQAFEALSPAELTGFLNSLNFNYGASQGGLLVLSYTDELVYNYFTAILRDFYSTYLHEANRPLMADLLQAMEYYGLRSYNEHALAQFNTLMEKISSAYGSLSQADRENFDQYLGAGYEKYLALHKLTTGTITVTLTQQEEELFGQLHLALAKFFQAQMKIVECVQNQQQVPGDLYAASIMLRSRADQIYQSLMEIASEDAMQAFYSKTYELLEAQVTLAHGYYQMDALNTGFMVSQMMTMTDENGVATTITLWEAYQDLNMAGVMSNMAEMVYQVYFAGNSNMPKEYLVQLMTQVRNLTLMQKSLLSAMMADAAYYRCMEVCLNANMSRAAAESGIAKDLLGAEIAYAQFQMNSENTAAKDNFLALMEKISGTYANLSAEDRACLTDAYTYYYALWEQMKTAQ